MQNYDMGLDEFVSALLRAKNIEDTSEAHDALVDDINSRVDQALLVALPEKDFNEISQLSSDAANGARIEEIISNSGIDIKGITERTLAEFRDEYLGGE